MDKSEELILLTGVTGYIGGRLLRALEAAGYRVRCLARRPEYVRFRIDAGTEVVGGDVFDPESLSRALAGVHTAYYLVHSLGGKGSFEANDRRAAREFGRAAAGAGVRRIIYFGGLGKGPDLSSHLASRQEVGEILRSSGVPTVEFRASIVIGSGSLSFEMVRALVQRLPVMTTPRWVRSLAQPIAIEDVLAYLVAALEREATESVVYEVGGADKVSYEGIMREYARLRGLRRLIIPVPALTPWLSSLWLALVTPLYFRVGRRLIEGVRSPTVVEDAAALRDFPVRPMGIRQAIGRALENEDREFAETRWTGALPARSLERRWGGVPFGSRLIDSRELRVDLPPPDVFRPIQCIGGRHGWYSYNWLWSLRGFIDKLLGGVGTAREPLDPRCVLPGDTVGFWRVEAMEPDRLLRLYAEMKLPGRAWLQFEVEPESAGSLVRQTAIFDPIGLGGLLYWYALYPLHLVIFRGMIRGIARAATGKEAAETGTEGTASEN
jgi:uncharacterized protein YbjT (DUF2867 family)